MIFTLSELVIGVLIAWCLAQGFKVITCSKKKNKLYLRGLMMGGGMPSSHTATVTALSVGIGLHQGFKTPLFVVTLVFSLMVIYQVLIEKRVTADLLKVIAEKHPRGHIVDELGHSLMEVFFGMLLGLSVVLAVMQN